MASIKMKFFLTKNHLFCLSIISDEMVQKRSFE